MQGAITYGEREIRFHVVHNGKLKTKIRIHVHPDARIEVEAPPSTSMAKVKEAVAKRARWISSRLADIEAAHKYALMREYVSGETHFYLGRRYQLKVFVAAEKDASVQLKGGLLRVTLPKASAASVRAQLEVWYRDRAKAYFQKRLDELGFKLPWVEHTPPIRLRVMKRQWGSCSPVGALILNPWLVRAPRECIDYVMLHELCHLREHNHSKEFYALLEGAYPGWATVKARLDGLAEQILAR